MRENSLETITKCKHGSKIAIMCDNSLAAEREPNFGVRNIAAFFVNFTLV